MAKLCIRCGKQIKNGGRKYCAECKHEVHLNQMSDYYLKNTKEYQYGGKYWNQQFESRCGTGSLGEHPAKNWEKEHEKIQKELRNLGLRQKKQHWR